MNCFICDLNCNPDCSSGAYISKTISSTGAHYGDIIANLIGTSFVVTIDEDDALCQTCWSIVEELDSYYSEIRPMEQMLTRHIYRKYKIELPDLGGLNDIDAKARQSFSRTPDNDLVCRNCLFRTSIEDCMTSHYKWHVIEEKNKTQRCVSSFVRPSVIISESVIEMENNVKDEIVALDVVSSDKDNIDQDADYDYAEVSIENDLQESDAHSVASNECAQLNESSIELSVEMVKSCKICGEPRTTRFPCLHEQALANGKIEHRCRICDIVCYSESLLLDHMQHKHYVCKECGIKFPTKNKVQYHYTSEHSDQQLNCDQCDKKFKTVNGLKRHYSQHTGKYLYTCEFCQKGCSTRNQYLDHRSIHTAEKRYTCAKCGKTFIHNTSYRMHMLYHYNPKPFECPECFRKFTTQPHLKVHRIRAHNAGEKTHACEYCERRFAAANQLKMHVATHTGVYQYNCCHCSKSFPKRIDYGKHLAKIHRDYSIASSQKKCEYKIMIPPSAGDDTCLVQATDS